MDAFLIRLSPNVRRSPRRAALRELSVTSPLRRSVTGNGNGISGANLPPSPMIQSSPDERIIQQRGRRSAIRNILNDMDTFDLEDARSPAKNLNDSGFDSPDGMLMTPRVEIPPARHLTSTPAQSPPGGGAPGTSSSSAATSSSSSSSKNMTSLSALTRKRLQMSPSKELAKRKRVQQKSKQKEVALATSLKGLSQDQLIDIICGLVDKHVDLEPEIKELAPAPDLEPLREKLTKLERNVYKSFPNTRFGSSRDAFCYRRVRTHLEEFKRECLQMGKALQASSTFAALADYVLLAWDFVIRLPDWDNFDHNKSKIQCFKQLATLMVQVVKKGAMEKEQLRGLKERIETLEDQGQYMEACLTQINKLLEKLR